MILWTEKYRPKTLDDYVWPHSEQRAKVERWIEARATPNLLLSGRPGVGKTSLGHMVLSLMGIPKSDILFINASREREADKLIDKVRNFGSVWADNSSGLRYVILDESDRLSPLTQDILKAEIETLSGGARFILTANKPEKLIEALHSRLETHHVDTLQFDEFLTRLATILITENVEFDDDLLLDYANQAYPDMRKAITLLQDGAVNDVLRPREQEVAVVDDWLLEALSHFRKNKFRVGRELIISRIKPDQYVDCYRALYRNLDIYGEDEAKQDDALIIIRDGLRHHAHVADPEICLSATIAELARLLR